MSDNFLFSKSVNVHSNIQKQECERGFFIIDSAIEWFFSGMALAKDSSAFSS
jgi:hypothetical protein